MSHLVLKDLVKQYPNGFTAVKGINLEINKGEFLVLLGPSGCGKTTTMRMIAGLEDVTEGDITVGGESIVDLKPKDREVSMIFQSYAVWPHMTVYNNIAYPLKLKKMSKEDIDKKVQEVAEMANIVENLDRYPAQLSGGQRQRVAVARAMAVEPKLFLMDEPLSNLDAKLRVSMRTDLKIAHQNLNSTTIFVTHDQSEAMSLADRIVVMNMGVIEQIGTPSEIYYESETMFVARFIGAPPTNFLDVEIVEKDGAIYAKNPLFELKIKDELTDVLRKNYVGETVVLGVRPENFTLNKEDALFDIEALLVEPQGSHTIIITNVNGKEMKVSTTEFINAKAGDKYKVGFNDKYLLFDKKTEKRIK